MSATWAVVLHYTGVDDTRECLRSLMGQTTENLRTVLVDNASSDGASSLFRGEFPGLVILRTETNLGWAGGNNLGIRHAIQHGAERIVLINNDAVADATLIERLNASGDAHPDFGILGPVVRDMDPPNDVQTDGFMFNDPKNRGFFRRRFVSLGESHPHEKPRVVETDVVMGCCFWLRKIVVDKIGLIDERYFLIHEETDYCLRAHRSGFKVGVLPESLVRHRKSPSFREAERRAGKPWQVYFDVRNLALLVSKFRGNGPHKRSRWKSWREYLLLVYYYHSDAIEHKDRLRARAVAEGLADAVLRRWGPYVERRRPFAAMFDAALLLARRIRRLFGPSGQISVFAPMETPGA
jgi:GT2 family glycosyltransferase